MEKFVRVPPNHHQYRARPVRKADAEHIRCRPRELYEERGREDGHEVEDSLCAPKPRSPAEPKEPPPDPKTSVGQAPE